MSRRVVFTFDDASLASLEKLKEKEGFSSLGTAMRRSIEVREALLDQADKGFTEIVLRNPSTKQEKTIVIPTL